MTGTETLEKRQLHKWSQNGSVCSDTSSGVEDTFDSTYREKEGPKPPRIIVWRNVILMSLLHLGAVYGVFLIPSASSSTLLWCK